MTKDENINKIMEKSKEVIRKKDDTIILLKTILKTMGGDKLAQFKGADIPSDVVNLIDIQRVKVENHPKIQDVNVLNLKDIKLDGVKVEMPDVQKVRVINAEKASSWVPEIITHTVKSLISALDKKFESGVVVRLDDEERRKPLPVIAVDARGRPVSFNMGNMIVPMPSNSRGNPPPTKITSGRKVVATAGTRVRLADAVTVCTKIIITAPVGNGGTIYVGDSSVSAVAGSEQGLMLMPTGSATIDIDDISKIYIDATVSGEGITYSYLR